MVKRWTIKEEIDGETWWVIRGGAFTNVINESYPRRLFESREDADEYCNRINMRTDRNAKVVKVKTKWL
mgnify:CR=1 FL=1|jgi:hypothetical protein|tara:strand:+ start:958 stop:1164 length:207 start_codon:yes stop_codon:yes gene_type:complete